MQYNFKVTKEDSGFSAHCVELNGCYTQGDTKAELEKNMKEALNLYLCENEDSKIIHPWPEAPKKGCIPVDVEPNIAFAMIMRQARIRKKMSQRQMQIHLGLRSLSNYQRLEDPKQVNPEFKTLVNIFRLMPEINFGLVFSRI